MSFLLALLLVTVSGFIALSYEILWFRIYSFISEGRATSFPFLLGFYLIGIAFGALLSKRYCKQLQEPRALHALTLFVICANLAGFFAIPIIANLLRLVHYSFTLPIVGLVAALFGAIFPLISHAAIRSIERAGPELSYLYIGNIIGSASGSLITGFVLMEYWTMPQIAVAIASLGLLLGALLIMRLHRSKRNLVLGITGITATIFLLAGFGQLFYDRLYEKLLFKDGYTSNHKFAHVIENRSGVITVTESGRLYGGGVYDGAFSLDLKKDINGIERAFAVGSLHNNPANVLMIGLGSGSWAMVIADHPAVQRLTIVEINPGYVSLLREYPDHAPLLQNPKVKIVIDDGRRWLRRNPDRRFDAIVANTTWNWRMHATNLLSVEYLQLIRKHLCEGGIYFYNTTDSPRGSRTGATVFPYALKYMNCVAVSDHPIGFHLSRWRQLLRNYQINGNPVFDLTKKEDRQRLNEIIVKAPEHIQNRNEILIATTGMAVITDDNMGTEWRRDH